MNARRAAALLEVLGVYVTGQYVSAVLTSALPLRIENPLLHINAQMTNAELLSASRDLFIILVVQYAGWFALIIPLNWWHRRAGPAAYGLTRAGKTWRALLAAGAAAAAFAAWPEISVELLDRVYDLGPTAPWRQALFDMSWRRWEFWLFAGILSYAFVAFMEELFFRGYCQRRLAEDWGDGPAICGTACLFVFAHGQYLLLNAYNVALLASLLVLALAMGVVFARTRSLWPSFVAHALINVPMTAFWQMLSLAGCLLATALLWSRGVAAIKRVFSRVSWTWCAVLSTIGAVYAVLSQYGSVAVYVAAVLLGLAVALEAMRGGDRTAPSSLL